MMTQSPGPGNQTGQKRILFVITQGERGGAQRFLSSLVGRLGSEYRIRIAVGSSGGDDLVRDLRDRGYEAVQLRWLRRSLHPIRDVKAVRELRNEIRSFLPDTLFLMSSKAGVVGSMAARRFPALRVVYRIGGWSFNDPSFFLSRCLYFLAERLTARWKDVIILNNRSDLRQAERWGIRPRQKLAYVPNGIDLSELVFLSRTEARAELSRSAGMEFRDDEVLIGTIANAYRTKGLEHLMQAMRSLPSRLVIIGEGSRTLARKNIVGTGPIPDAFRLLPAFDVFVLPSVKEGSPWTILEAMAARVPIVATTVGGIPELIESGRSGLLVPPRNPRALAEAIRALLSDPDRGRLYADQAFQTVSSMTLDGMAEAVRKLL